MVGSLSLLTILAFLGVQDPAPHEERSLDFRVRTVFPFLEGDISVTDNNLAGSTLDLEDTLDLESPGDSADIMVSALIFPWFRIHAEYWVSRFQGSNTVEETYNFGGSVYNTDDSTKTDLELQIGSLMGEYNVFLYKTPHWRFELGLEVGAGIIGLDIHQQNSSAEPVFSERQRFNTPIPLVGLFGKLEVFDTLMAEIRIKGIQVQGFQDADITLFKASAEVQAFLFKGVYMSAGWQLLINKGKVEPHSDEEVDYDFTFNGPFFSFGYTF
jgi:hypothetical protein